MPSPNPIPNHDPKPNPTQVYSAYLRILCADARRTPTSAAPEGQQPTSPTSRTSEHSTPVASRMGFVPVPLLCLVLRVVGHDVIPRFYFGHPSGWALCLVVWLLLCFLKVLTGITLLGYACARGEEEPPNSPIRLGVGVLPSDFLSGVDRFTLHGKRIM